MKTSVRAQTALTFASIGLFCASADRTYAEAKRPNGSSAPDSLIYKAVGDRKLKLDISYPPAWNASDKRPAIVFFSGGGFRNGTTGQFRPQADYFAKRGLVAVRAEYRDRKRDNVMPDVCLEDAMSAMRWVRKHAGKLGVDPGRIVASGGSAGGYLALATYTIKGIKPAGDDLSTSCKPNAMVLFNPVVDFVSISDRTQGWGIDRKRLEQLSPLRNMTKDIPPTLILIGTLDAFWKQVDAFVTKAKKLGVPVERYVGEGAKHAFFNRSPWLERTVVAADEFLQKIGYLEAEPKVKPPTRKPRPRKARAGRGGKRGAKQSQK